MSGLSTTERTSARRNQQPPRKNRIGRLKPIPATKGPMRAKSSCTKKEKIEASSAIRLAKVSEKKGASGKSQRIKAVATAAEKRMAMKRSSAPAAMAMPTRATRPSEGKQHPLARC